MLDFLSMSTVVLRLRLGLPHVAQLMVLRHVGEPLEAWEIFRYSGMSRSAGYRALWYLLSKGLVDRRRRKDQHRQAVWVWVLSVEGTQLVQRVETLYRRVASEWSRRFADRAEQKKGGTRWVKG